MKKMLGVAVATVFAGLTCWAQSATNAVHRNRREDG